MRKSIVQSQDDRAANPDQRSVFQNCIPDIAPMSWSFSRVFCGIQRYYSSRAEIVTQEARRKWGLSGLPSPRSILCDDDSPLLPPLSLSESSSEHEDAPHNPSTPPLHLRKPPTSPTPKQWVIHRRTLRELFPNGWAPHRKVSRTAMDGIRELHRIDPERFTTPFLADRFRVSPEAIRRILKSNWVPETRKGLEKERRKREVIFAKQRKVFEAEIEETRNIMEGRKFRGGLELREIPRSPSRMKQR